MKIHLILLSILLVVLMASCTISPSGNPVSPNSTPGFLEITPTSGELRMTPSLSAPDNSIVQGLVEMAQEDLAARLSIDISQIQLVEASETEWSDSSLGCPQPGMDYLQVITPGYLILLEVDAQTYEYHSNRDAYVVYCQEPTPPALPKP